MIEERDFVGLGLAEHVQQKIFANLVFRGYLQADGGVVESALPQSADGASRWPGTSTPSARRLFEMIAGLLTGQRSPRTTRTGGAGQPRPPGLFPSDLEDLLDGVAELSPAEQRRAVRQPGLQPLPRPGRDRPVGGVLRRPGERRRLLGQRRPRGGRARRCGSGCGTGSPRSTTSRSPSTPRSSPTLRLTPDEIERLLENLRFNGYLDRDGNYVGQARAAGAAAGTSSTSRWSSTHTASAILDAIQGQTRRAPGRGLHVDTRDFADIADDTLASRIVAELEGTYLADGRVRDDAAACLLAGRRPAGALAGP